MVDTVEKMDNQDPMDTLEIVDKKEPLDAIEVNDNEWSLLDSIGFKILIDVNRSDFLPLHFLQ